MDRLTGVILCGGESRRMGRDKGLILKDGVPWARQMAEKLSFLLIPVVFSVNPLQMTGYADQLGDACLVKDEADLPGPLNGLLSVHAQFPQRDLLLLACDMVDMDESTIARLVEAYHAGGPYEFYAHREGGFYQPFCAIYTARSLDIPLQQDSLQALLKRGRTKALPILRNEAFMNYNT
jgi:molybdopterin-guanine dinucleotide biosynthesis protein A